LKGPSQQAVVGKLTSRKAVVTPEHEGCVVVFDEQSDDQDQEVIADLASQLSSELQCPVLAMLNHDDDILWYRLYENGELSDEYDSRAPDIPPVEMSAFYVMTAPGWQTSDATLSQERPHFCD
jgi:hypothetical protein